MSPQLPTGPPDIPGLTFVKELGAGGYSVVYLYQQAERPVAVKVISAEDISDEVRRRLTAEASAMGALVDHPNIVQVLRAGVAADGRPYLVMHYYPNPNLAVRSKRERLSLSEVLSIGVRIACAVETAHRAGILHRDIKPANILTSRTGAPALTDFGIATTTMEATGGEQGMSVPWAPPEVIRAMSTADVRSDVYSLGATLWSLLVGRSPFEIPGGDNSSYEIGKRIRTQPPPPTGRADVPASLERLLAQSMAKSPLARPDSALSFAQSLQAVQAEERWPLTELVVFPIDSAPASTSANEETDGADSTQRRGPRVIVPHAPRPAVAEDTSRRPSARDADATERTARVVPGGQARAPEDQTYRRTTVDPQERHQPQPQQRPQTEASRSRRPFVIGGGVAAAVALAAAAVLIAHGGGGTGGPGPAPTTASTLAPTTCPPALGAQCGAPGVPNITWTRVDRTRVGFAWTYNAPLPGDQFRWRFPGGAWTNVATPAATVTDPVGQQVCIEVQASRAQSGDFSPISAPVCGG